MRWKTFDKNRLINKIVVGFEILIGIILLLVIFVKLLDLIFVLVGLDITLLVADFEEILTVLFNLIIGTEFVRMLYKHTSEALIEVLLFVIARTMVLPSSDTIQIIVGVFAISALFAIKKYLLVKKKSEKD